jgi:two-component SAPR family response regulator
MPAGRCSREVWIGQRPSRRRCLGGAEAMARLAGPDASVDVLITDVIMPKMSGIDLAELVMDRYPQVGVVLLSGYTAETLNLERVTTRGATFVPKPVT